VCFFHQYITTVPYQTSTRATDYSLDPSLQTSSGVGSRLAWASNDVIWRQTRRGGACDTACLQRLATSY